MLHDVMTAAKGGELVSAQLPLYAGEKKVRAAQIVALGMGSQPGQTRLALAGGAHVEVGKAWMQKTGARAGQYYTQGEDGVNEAVEAAQFESSFSPTEDSGAVPVETTEATILIEGHVVKVSEVEEAFKDLEGQNERLRLERDGARSRITQLENERAVAKAHIAALEKELAATTEGRDKALQALADSTARRRVIVEGTVGANVRGGAPSAEDLDRVADDQKQKDATSGEQKQAQE